MAKGQNRILDTLMEGPKNVQDLLYDTGLSISFIRGQIKYLEACGSIEKVDDRIPHIYRIPINSPMLKHKRAIAEYKEALLDPESKETFVRILQKNPKSQWLDIADAMEACAIAIRDLNSEGLLVETLEA